MPAESMATLAQLALLNWLSEEEREVQRDIVKARAYHNGQQFTFLTDRLREFLDIDDVEIKFRLNVCRPVVTSVVEKMILLGFDVPGAESEQADASGVVTKVNPQSQWLQTVMRENHLDVLAVEAHEIAISEGEAFILCDYDEEAGMPVFTLHRRYTDPQVSGIVSLSRPPTTDMNWMANATKYQVNGDGEGCRAHYANDDPNQALEYVAKRWMELYVDGDGHQNSRMRMTVYYPDRVEKFVWDQDWTPFLEEDDGAWPLWWTDTRTETGDPLGIAAIHFRNKGMRPEATDALPLQDGINKTYIDFLAASDSAGLGINVAFGWIPTTDGQVLASDGSNALQVAPGMTIGTTKSRTDADFIRVAAENLTPLLDSVDRQIAYVAMVTDTPVQRFQMTRQVAAADTLQAQNNPLDNKVRLRESVMGESWEKAMELARRLENAYGSEDLDESFDILAQWAPLDARSVADRAAEANAKKTSGIPDEQIWRDVWGYDENTIERMKAMPSYQAKMNLLATGLQNLGAAGAA